MNKITEIKTDYTCDQNLHHIDVYFEGTEEGKTVAVVDHDTNKVIFFDNSYRMDEKVKEAIKEITGDKLEKFPNGFDSWKETHYEITQAIVLEMIKSQPTGLANKTHEAQGTGGLYELAEELTDMFENMYKGFEWDGEFFDEIDRFCKIKLYSDDVYMPIIK